jgi:hypothetical protein
MPEHELDAYRGVFATNLCYQVHGVTTADVRCNLRAGGVIWPMTSIAKRMSLGGGTT